MAAFISANNPKGTLFRRELHVADADALVRQPVADDTDVADRTDRAEKITQLLLLGVEGEVAEEDCGLAVDGFLVGGGHADCETAELGVV
jgi:hypothetical protein